MNLYEQDTCGTLLDAKSTLHLPGKLLAVDDVEEDARRLSRVELSAYFS